MKISKTNRDFPDTWYNKQELKVQVKLTYAEIWYLLVLLEQFFDYGKNNKKNYLLEPGIGERLLDPDWLNELGGSYERLTYRLIKASIQIIDRLLIAKRVKYSSFHMRRVEQSIANTVQMPVTLEMTYADLWLLSVLLEKKEKKNEEDCQKVFYIKDIEFEACHSAVAGIIEDAILIAFEQLEKIYKSTKLKMLEN